MTSILFILAFALLAFVVFVSWFQDWRQAPRNRDTLRRWKL
jgi:hypothetical protein